MRLPILLAALALLTTLPLAAADENPCVERSASAGDLPVARAGACKEGEAYACHADGQGGLWCEEVHWCLFCPGPVLW